MVQTVTICPPDTAKKKNIPAEEKKIHSHSRKKMTVSALCFQKNESFRIKKLPSKK